MEEELKAKFIEIIKMAYRKSNFPTIGNKIDKYIAQNPDCMQYIDAKFLLDIEKETGISLNNSTIYRKKANLIVIYRSYEFSLPGIRSLEIVINKKRSCQSHPHKGFIDIILPTGIHNIQICKRRKSVLDFVFRRCYYKATIEIVENQRTTIECFFKNKKFESADVYRT